jgi:diguanylate cyclase (GGDEF)-like protein
VAATLQDATRTGDVLARWGGEEFAVLVEASDRAGLAQTAERLRVLVARSEVRLGKLTRTVYVSVGGTLATREDTAESLFTRAVGHRRQREQVRGLHHVSRPCGRCHLEDDDPSR